MDIIALWLLHHSSIYYLRVIVVPAAIKITVSAIITAIIIIHHESSWSWSSTIIIIIRIITIMLRMLNPLVNLCENGFSASQIVSAIKVLFHRIHMYFRRDTAKKKRFFFKIDLWSLIYLSNNWSTNIGASCSNIPDAFKLAQWDNLNISNILLLILYVLYYLYIKCI